MNRICLYYKKEPERDRWVYGDRFIRPTIRHLLRGSPNPGGIDKVAINLCKGLDMLNTNYVVNLPFNKLESGDLVGVLGLGRSCLRGYKQSNPIVAGIGLMSHPSEWPTLCEEYPVIKYLQHSDWANNVYKPYYGERCTIWPVGIDTYEWTPLSGHAKTNDFLIYNKIRWKHETFESELLNPLRNILKSKNLSYEELRYGFYKPEDYKAALKRCRAMIFICEHESQGIAYQECLSSDIPILAWDQGQCLDPNRFEWGTPDIPATSVPYWDNRCGVKFRNIQDFPVKLEKFLYKLKNRQLHPRDYIIENLTLEKCAQKYINIIKE